MVTALAGAVGAMQVLAYGESDRPTARNAGGQPAAGKKAKRGTKVKLEATEYGKALVNGAGKAFYLFDAEETPKPECYGDCAAVWPPVLTKGKPYAGKGVKARKLGTTKRNDGTKQVTFAGHPLYYYVHDTPDKILCQDVFEFGGRWLLVKPSGQALR